MRHSPRGVSGAREEPILEVRASVVRPPVEPIAGAAALGTEQGDADVEGDVVTDERDI